MAWLHAIIEVEPSPFGPKYVQGLIDLSKVEKIKHHPGMNPKEYVIRFIDSKGREMGFITVNRQIKDKILDQLVELIEKSKLGIDKRTMKYENGQIMFYNKGNNRWEPLK